MQISKRTTVIVELTEQEVAVLRDMLKWLEFGYDAQEGKALPEDWDCLRIDLMHGMPQG